MKALGQHILIELYLCNVEKIDNQEYLESILCKAAEIAGATIVNSTFHRFSPFGVSGVVVIQESHFAVHSWPEHGYTAIDLFTCSDAMDYKAAYNYLAEALESKEHEYKHIERGEKAMGYSSENSNNILL